MSNGKDLRAAKILFRFWRKDGQCVGCRYRREQGSKRIPRGVIGLISALAFHELTTQVPHEIHLALPRTARRPRLGYPPLRVYRFSQETMEAGVDTHVVDGVTAHVFSPEKTLADCFKYRGKIGMEVVLEALRVYRRKEPQFQRVLEYARICRVERIIRPYLEATLLWPSDTGDGH